MQCLPLTDECERVQNNCFGFLNLLCVTVWPWSIFTSHNLRKKKIQLVFVTMQCIWWYYDGVNRFYLTRFASRSSAHAEVKGQTPVRMRSSTLLTSQTTWIISVIDLYPCRQICILGLIFSISLLFFPISSLTLECFPCSYEGQFTHKLNSIVISSPKKENSVINYSPSSFYELVFISFFCWT